MPGVTQASFTAGELAPALHGRVDLARYFTGLKRCENFIVRQYGGVSNRPGSRLVAEVADSSKRVRLIPFQFNVEQSYILEFGEGYIRVHKEGGTVVKTLADTADWATATEYGQGAFVEYSGALYYCLVSHVSGTWATDLAAGKWRQQSIYELPTPYQEEDLPLLKFTQSADVLTVCHPSYVPFQISRTAHNAWTATAFNYSSGPFLPMNVDTAKTIYSNAAGGAVTLTANWNAFATTDVGRIIRLEQMPDDSTKRWEVDKAIATGEIRRAGGHYYICLGAGQSGTVRPTVCNEGDTESDGAVRWQYLHSGYGIAKIVEYVSATQVKAEVQRRLPDSVVLSAPNAKTATAMTNVAGRVRLTITAHGFATNDYVFCAGFYYKVLAVAGKGGGNYWQYWPHEANGWWRVSNIDANTIELVDCAYVHDPCALGTVTKSGSGMATYKWFMGAWGDAVGYPATTAYYQQRQFFGGSAMAPQTLEASCIRGYTNFIRSMEPMDDEAISFIIDAREVNQIRHFLPLSDLIVLTSGGEWLCKGEDGILTPATINVKNQGYGGASHVPPVVVGSTGLYVQNKGQQIRAIGYSFADDAFVSQDLTTMSSHLFLGREVQEWAYQQVPFSCVWSIRDDGVLLGLTYMREQEVVGWHRHTTDGVYESVAVVSEGNKDVTYTAVRRTINGQTKRFIEYSAPRDFTDIRDAYFVDCGLTYDGRNTGAVTFTLSGGTTWAAGESLTLTASSSTFVAGDVDKRFSFVDGTTTYRLTVTAYTSGTVVTVTCNRTIPTAYRAAAFTNWIREALTLSGLSHLEGKTVSVLADGNVHPQLVVSSGSITLQYWAGVIHVGLPYASEMETLALTSPSEQVRDLSKLISKLGLIVESSRGIWAGPDSSHLTEYKGRSYEGYDSPAATETGYIELRTMGSWTKDGHMVIHQADPLPLSILALVQGVAIGS